MPEYGLKTLAGLLSAKIRSTVGLTIRRNFSSETVSCFYVLQPDIPHIDEHVSKVECIGVKTQQKLLDIKGAAAAVGIQDLNVIHNSITTGGHSTAARSVEMLQISTSGPTGKAVLHLRDSWLLLQQGA